MLIKTKTSPVIVINPESDDRSFYRLTKNVIRIGSDPRSDIKFTESLISRHAVTIEQREDEILIHNKAGYQLLLDEEPIPANHHITWHDHGRLILNDNLEMILLKNPQKRSRSIESHRDGYSEVDPTIGDKSESKSHFRIAVFSSLIVLFAIPTLMMDGPNGRLKDRQEAEKLEKLLIAANNGGIKDPLKPRIAQQLQLASRREFRENANSDETLIQMRNLINSLKSKEHKLPDLWYEEAMFYILEKLKNS